MCKGREDDQEQRRPRQRRGRQKGGFRWSETAAKEEVSGRTSVACELCDSEAALYCQADGAYLCRKCDQLVHGANFLARRHVRCFLCSSCQGLTRRCLVGASSRVLIPAAMIRNSNPMKRKCSTTLRRPRPCLYL
ncbi:B-box domain protein 30-like [Diospyros lotus]|uniref:B-box domain protein 30-like n=1 Tax=Diospyros lotus TaxID=55363 RepID=UPI002256D83A|nr:B-box domain protein 30-like [Diospyros lotus]